MKWGAVLLLGILMGGCSTPPAPTQNHRVATGGSSTSNFDTKVRNQVLDDIIISRRTIRDFRPDFPAEDMVRQIITAGLHAPYTLTAVENFRDGYFRRNPVTLCAMLYALSAQHRL